MASYYKLQIEKIHQLRTEADKLQEDLNADIAALIEEGLVASPQDEDPAKAVGRYVREKLEPEAVISAADIKRNVPCTRDLTHRGITVLLAYQPFLTALDTKDQFGLKQFVRHLTAISGEAA